MTAALVASLAFAAAARTAPSPCAAPPLPSAALERANEAKAWPTFCSIPPAPKGVRTPAEYRSAVQAVRGAGAHLQRQVRSETFTLEESQGFAKAARRAAQPPPPMTEESPTDAFVQKMRRRAAPPPRHHLRRRREAAP
ncbi:MAG: hypothetical protein ACRED9_02765 [Caulobacteraceae bacterium]